MKNYDAIVVGGSFAGLSAAMQLVRARRKVLLLDSGKPRNRFSPAVHGFLGLDGMAPGEIKALALGQLRAYPMFEYVEGVAHAAHRQGEGFVVEWAQHGHASSADEMPATQSAGAYGTCLILATGVTDTLPPIAGLAERWGQTVLHCPYCHGYEVGGGAIGVLAAFPQSAHQATMLPDWGDTTYFTQAIHEPAAEEAAQLLARGVRIERVPVVELLGGPPALEAVRLADGRVLALRAIFTAPATAMASPLAEQLGCAFDAGPTGPHIQVDALQQTSIPGVFAAGDAATARHNGVLATAAGLLAGVSAHRALILAA